MHFFTDRNFNCGKYPEFEKVRLYNIVGADLAEKGRIIQITGDIFSESPKSFYYSPYEISLPCAVYFPELRALAACSYNEYSAAKLTSRYFDIGRILEKSAAHIEEIAGYTMSQSRAYMAKSLELIGIADLLLKEYIKNGDELLKSGKLRSYAVRKISSMLINRGSSGKEMKRSISAITCTGYKFAELPDDYRIIRVCDRYIAASRLFIRFLSAQANHLGYDTIIAGAVDSEHAPLHLMIPDAKLVFITESEILPVRFAEREKISLERFYNRELLFSREHNISFFGEYIKKMYGEASLYARICMDIKNQGRKLLMPYITEKAADEIASEIVYSVLNT